MNVAASTGLQRSRGATRHSSVLDFDRDGDMDIYENNFVRRSVLWENQLADRGGLGFLNATAKRDLVGDGSIGGPRADQAMCSIASDLNNDGWQDLVLLHRGRDEPGSTDGHQVLINVEGTGFVDVAEHTGISDTWHERTEPPTMGGPMGIGWGVMGCQVGDVDLDGFPDVYVGTGVGSVGDVDRLFVSRGRVTVSIEGVGDVVVPQFENWTSLVDFPADPVDGAPTVPYPYRTHGTALADFDGDGVPEIGVHNGGPAAFGFIEPNRLFKLDLPDPRFLRIRLVGNGRTVNRDGVGAEVVVTAYREWDRHEWELHQFRQSATGFGAQNESDLVFGLADADEVSQIVVNWPDGTSQQVTPAEGTANWMVVQQP